jgi:hypothetical protein
VRKGGVLGVQTPSIVDCFTLFLKPLFGKEEI